MAGAVRVVLKSVFDDKGVRQAQQELGNLGKGIGIAFAAVSAAVVGAGLAITKFGSEAVSAAEEVRQADNRLNQVAQSMGLFGAQTEAVTNRLIAFAEANELNLAIDAETIKLTQSKLLTFKELATTADDTGGAFDRATMAALDLAAAGFGSAETNATQLGKALQDPIKGLTALTRSGVTFTKQEKENIKTLVESGQTLKAQDLILQAIETQVGGTAEATAKASDKMKLAFENVYETVGEALLPVFDELANEIIALTPEISKALTPVFMELAGVFRKEVIPLIKEFTGWLASPQGTQAVRDLTKAVVDTVKGIFDFSKYLAANWDQIVLVTTAIVSLVGAIKIVTTVVTIARAAMLLFGVALTLNPLGLLITALALAVTGFVALSTGLNGSTTALDKNAQATKALEDSQDQLAYKIKQGGFESNQYQKKLVVVNDKLMLLKTGFSTSAGEANKFNNIKLNGVNSQIDSTALKLKGLFNQFGETTGEARRFANLAPTAATVITPVTTTDSGPSAREQTQKIIKEAQKRVREALKDYNETVAKARTEYNKAIAEATKTYTEAVTAATTTRDKSLAAAEKEHAKNVSSIQADFAKKQQDIITQSINRLRDAYKQSVQVNVANLFGTDAVGKSVDKLVTSLRDRLQASKQLIENSAKLASAGFSQTFIEQVVGAGVESGNELANAILTATPEAQAELRGLFGAIETQSETGMDGVAQTIYDKTGLATSELRALFEQTNEDLATALLGAEQVYLESQAAIMTTFDNSMLDATKTRDKAFADAAEALKDSLTNAAKDYGDALKGIKEDTLEALGELETGFGGLDTTVKAFITSLNTAIGKSAQLGVSAGIAPVFPGAAGVSTTNATTNNVNYNVSVNAGVGTNGTNVGKAIVEEILRFERASGNVWTRAAV